MAKFLSPTSDRLRRYKPPKGQKLRKELRHERKAFVARHCQAVVGQVLAVRQRREAIPATTTSL